ncbi:unnamed protein product [Ectocarpus sp. CCAP 1310/34]|nr:unnamed protein product [Ectocarpus sp. CCAP 1310/34]
MPHKDHVVICSSNKEELYQDFLTEAKRVYPEDTSKRVSKAHFFRIPRKDRPHIRVRVGGEFMKCDICVTLKERRHGSPGVKPSLDSSALASIDRDLAAHRQMVQADRLVIANRTGDAMRAKADGKPLNFVFMSIDAANSTSHALPAIYPPTHGGDRGYSERQKIMAVHIEGQFVEVYFTPQYLGGGCNLACTAAHLAITRIIDKYHDSPPHPSGCIIQHAHWQVDNCVSENKNNFFLGYAGLLVAADVVRVVEIHFMMVGHTHTKIDQVFSRFSRGIKGKNIFTRTHLAEELRASYTEVPVFCSTLRNEGNFKGLLIGRVNRVPNITTYRAFRVEKGGDGRVKVRVKKHMHGAEWNGIHEDGNLNPDALPHDLFIGSPPRIQDAPPYKLKRVPEDVIQKVEQRYLASHERLAAAFPLDDGAVQRAKDEQKQSVRLLRQTGEREFDLPVHWLPVYDSGSGDEENVGPDTGDNNDAEQDFNGSGGHDHDGIDDEADDTSSDSDMEPEFRRRGRPRATGRPTTDRSPPISVQVGSFAFFVARRAPFLVGRIVAERLGEEGERGVDLHWLRPSSDYLSNNAASVTLREYSNSTFVEGFVLDTCNGNGRSGKAKRVKDVSWEPVEGIVATCERLVGNGRKVPTKVLRVLRAAVEARDRANGIIRDEPRLAEQEEGVRDEMFEDELTEDDSSAGVQQEQEKGTENYGRDEAREPMTLQGSGRSEGGEECAGVGVCGEECLPTAMEAPAPHRDEGQKSAEVRKRPNPTTQESPPTARVRLTAAHFRPRRGACP